MTLTFVERSFKVMPTIAASIAPKLLQIWYAALYGECRAGAVSYFATLFVHGPKSNERVHISDHLQFVCREFCILVVCVRQYGRLS